MRGDSSTLQVMGVRTHSTGTGPQHSGTPEKRPLGWPEAPNGLFAEGVGLFFFRHFNLNKDLPDERQPLCYHWRELPQVSFLSRQTSVCLTKHVLCCNKSMLVTKEVLLLSQRKYFVMTNIILLGQNFCHTHTFVVTKDVFCRNKHVFVVTKVCLS